MTYCDGTIQNNRIRGNSARYGGGLRFCGGTIEDNQIVQNSASAYGGGLADCHGTIRNNTIGGNSAAEYGGGLFWCNGTIQNNTITGNSAYGGGGLDRCDGTIQSSTIAGNSAEYGGGLRGCEGVIQNNTITGNSAGASAGGLLSCNGTIQNNTIAGNSAEMNGGALYRCNGTIRNCIIWVNTAPSGPQLEESSDPTYSCIEGWTGDPATGNIPGDPCFAGPDAGDFRLLPDSPCIDAGYNDPALPATDIASMHRIMFGGKSLTVDIGAYEFYINELTPGPNPDETTFSWSSLADRIYSIFYSGDLMTWHLAVESFPSSGNTTTSWIDDGSKTGTAPPLTARRFYRVLENP